jgi:hypothetical protein
LRLRVAPASVGNSWDPSVSVSPWDVEYQPNPVLFSHFNNSPVGSQDDVSPVSVTSPSWPTAPAEVQSLGLFEMDAVENEFNPWLHGPIPTVQGVPHRWEKTPGTDRMFFEAEHDLFPRRKKRRTSKLHETLKDNVASMLVHESNFRHSIHQLSCMLLQLNATALMICPCGTPCRSQATLAIAVQYRLLFQAMIRSFLRGLS